MTSMKSGKNVSKPLCASILAALFLSVAFQPLFAADFVSKKYQFKRDIWLELGASVSNVSIKSIKFNVPAEIKGKYLRISGPIRADIVIENKSDQDQKIGIALALFDSGGNLIGVASGGSKWFFKIKSGQQKEYSVTFSYVTEMIEEASTFQITLELR